MSNVARYPRNFHANVGEFVLLWFVLSVMLPLFAVAFAQERIQRWRNRRDAP